MIAQLCVFITPLAAILVDQLSVVPAMRILFFFAFISMTTKAIIFFRFGDETEVGRTRKRNFSSMSIWQIMSGYWEIYKRIFASRDMILALTIMTVFNITSMISTSFFGLYVTGYLMVPDHLLAYFPVLRSIIIVAFFFLFQPWLERFGFRNPLLIGLSIFLAGICLLIFTPVNNLYILFIYAFIDAVSFSFVLPRSEALTQLLIEPSERARIRGLMMVIALSLSVPFGYFAGFLSDMDRRYPFILIAVFITLMFIVLAADKQRLDNIGKHD